MAADGSEMTAGDRPRLDSYSALILNFGHWRDTLACAESVLASDIPPRRVVICDNGSSDDSLDHLARWIAQRGKASGFRQFTRAEAEGFPGNGGFPAETLLLVDNEINLGYAGGNNVGLRLLLRSDAPFVWILNNDTEVAPNAADALLAHMRDRPDCGLCGALTRYLETPEIVQCYGGGWYNPLWALGGLHGEGDSLPLGAIPRCGPTELDYVNGASVFVRREFLLDVGLMDEDYFLYCEEWDWAERARRKRWTLCWTPEAEVLHREGLSTAASARRGLRRSARSAWRLIRSRLLFTWKFRPWALPLACAGQLYALLRKAPLSFGKRGADK